MPWSDRFHPSIPLPGDGELGRHSRLSKKPIHRVTGSPGKIPIQVKIPRAMTEFDARFRDGCSNYGRCAVHGNLPRKRTPVMKIRQPVEQKVQRPDPLAGSRIRPRDVTRSRMTQRGRPSETTPLAIRPNSAASERDLTQNRRGHLPLLAAD